MAKNKKRVKTATEYTIDCECGAKAAVFELEKGYMAHCPNCGAITFFDNPVLLQRLRFGGKLCPHEPEKKPAAAAILSGARSAESGAFYMTPKREKSHDAAG
jgi:hypothetical protein